VGGVLNLLFAAICMLVPIAGPMVLMGWAFDVLTRTPEWRWESGSDFDINKLGKYFMRGLWPFLVQLIVSIPVGLVAGMLWVFLFMGVGMSAAASRGSATLIFAIFPAYFIGIVVLSTLIQMLAMPMCLRAGLTKDLGSAFAISWVLDFIKRTWGEMLLSALFMMVTGPIVFLVGLALFCVGVYPAQALVGLASYHLWFQIYDLYLERGGEPISLTVDAPDKVRYQGEN
jgi:hypothetical protein